MKSSCLASEAKKDVLDFEKELIDKLFVILKILVIGFFVLTESMMIPVTLMVAPNLVINELLKRLPILQRWQHLSGNDSVNAVAVI